MAETSKIMFNKGDGSGHPCLTPDLRRNAFSFPPLRIMLAVGLSCMAFITLRKVPLCPLSGEFSLLTVTTEFCQMLFLHLLRDHIVFLLQFVNVLLSQWLCADTEQAIPGINPIWIRFASILLRKMVFYIFLANWCLVVSTLCSNGT